MSERRAGPEKGDVSAEPAANGRRPKLVPEASNTGTGPSRRGSGVDMRAKDSRVNTGNPARSGARPQPEAREGQAGPGGVTEGPGVAKKRVTIAERRGPGSRATPKERERGD
jgi:hypothetical protein